MVQDVVVVNIIKDVVESMHLPGIDKVNFQPGRSSQILQKLSDIDQSVYNKDTKYPLIALLTPITEVFGSGIYCTARIGKIVIATLSNYDDSVLKKYEQDQSFAKTLYPCFTEFFKKLALSTSINIGDPGAFSYRKQDYPGEQPIEEGTNDFIDSIHILDLELPLTQIKTC